MMRSKRGEEMTMEEIESNGVISSSTGAATSRNHLEAVKHPSSSSSSKKGGSKDEEAKTIPYYRLFSFVDSFDVMLMIIGTIGAIGNGVSLPVMTLLFGNIVNSFGDNPERGEMLAAVAKVSLQFVYLAIGNGIASALQVICWSVTGERQTSRIRNMYLETILRQDIAFFDKDTNSGEVIERISGDTFLIQDAMGEKVGKFIQFLATFLGGFVVSFVQGWLLTLVMLTIIPPLVFSGALLAQVLTRMAIQGQNAYTEAANIADQTISSIRTVASFTGEKKAINKYNKSIKIAAKASVRKGIATGLGAGAVMFVMFCGYSLGVWYGGKLILSNGYTGGHVITVILALISASFTLGQAVPCMTAFSKGQAAGYKMFETINRKPEIDSYDNSGKMMDDIQGDIELRNVVFSYPTRPNEKIFSGFSLSINNGMSVALVGESGSGKSTVISLIERFYDPQSGQVLIDNINIKEFQLRWIRSKIGLVSQEPVLFLSSIRDNIAYGSNGATFEEIKAVAELANASKFIDKMPQGFETMVGENGTQLSGGQKQRIAIARAILKDPKILLLDEATSALDAESERIVQEALDRVITNRTTVMVAHRLSTVKNADMIVVIHRGAIVEKGSHSELCHDQNGAYSQLIRLQEVNKDSNANDLDGTYSARSLSTLNRSLKHRSLSQKKSTGNNNQQNSLTDESMVIPISSKYIESHEQTQKASIRQLAKLNKPEIPVLILGAIAAIIQGLIMPIFGLLLSQVIGAFYKPPDQLKKETRFWALMLIIAGLVSLFIYPLKVSLFAFAGSELVKRVRSMCFEKVVYMEVGWFDNSNNSSGAIGTRLSTDSESVRGIVGDSLAFIVMNTASMVVGLVISFTASWKLSLIVLALAPLIGLSEYVQMNFIKGFGDDAKTMYEDASQVANDAVRNIRTVASFLQKKM